MTVAWYASVSEMINGVAKNTFAGLDYSLVKLGGLTFLQLLTSIWPQVSLLVLSGPARLAGGLVILVRLLFFAVAARRFSVRPWYALWILLTPFINLYMVWRAVILTLARGGILWRGTFYPLGELRKNRLR